MSPRRGPARSMSGLVAAGLMLLASPSALAQPPHITADTLIQNADRVLKSPDGFLLGLSVSPGRGLTAPAAVVPATPGGRAAPPDFQAVATSFMATNSPAFDVPGKSSFITEFERPAAGGRSTVRLRQTHEGLPVFGATVQVQFDAQGRIVYVLSDIARASSGVDSLSVNPAVDAAAATVAAAERAAEEVARRTDGDMPDDLQPEESPELMVYDPAVIGESGAPVLVWEVVMISPSSPLIREQVLVNAQSGEVALFFKLVPDVINRQVYDCEDVSGLDPGILKRSEGQAATGIADVDQAYDYLGDTYTFYWTRHSWDSLDGAGMPLSISVRYCPRYYRCPMRNAGWSTTAKRLYFGEAMVADDVLAHEYTHGVTQYTSSLVYHGESGAINESFSDIWGEFADLVNGRGTDTAENR